MQDVPFETQPKQQPRSKVQKCQSVAVSPVKSTISTLPLTLESLSPWLLGCCCRQLRRCEQGVFMSRTVVREGFSSAYPGMGSNE
jgi:hypothetical protein